jgi:hypothetical protein
MSRSLFLVSVALLLGACSGPFWPSDGPCQNDQESGCGPGPSCKLGTNDCTDDGSRVCGQTSDGIGWLEEPPCAEFGAVCQAGHCDFGDQACPANTDSFCLDATHLLVCANDKLSGFLACDSPLSCRTNTVNGRTVAECAIEGDLCESNADASWECRDNAQVECAYGLPLTAGDCGAYTCSTTKLKDGHVYAACD